MSELLAQLAVCIERGKVNKASPYPPDLRGQDGAEELTKQALDSGVAPSDILEQGLIIGMGTIGHKFSRNEVFVPDLLMAAKAMSSAMVQLKPFFESGQARHKGTIVIGTVKGDLHDIGKKLVAMVLEGGGWNVIDLNVDVAPEKFVETLKQHPGAALGMSALLTTTMVNMEETVKRVRQEAPSTKIIIGGAPVTDEFRAKIGADAYSPDPQGALDWLNAQVA
ncbi:MAG TPA: corrinoid protein [Candidatus Hydrogenedentes bacterium]|nr:corrinoid protein [Candidatus Hydrogenedentota bacterium]